MKELGWTVIACPVCRGVKRAQVFQSRQRGVLMGLLPTRGRAIMVQRCRGCAVEMIRDQPGLLHADGELSADEMLAMEEQEEAERIVAEADLFQRMAEGDIDEVERTVAIEIVCEDLMQESLSMNTRWSNLGIYFMSFAAIGTLIFGLAPRNVGSTINSLLTMLLLATGVAIWVYLILTLHHLRRTKEDKRLPAVLRSLDPSVPEVRRAVDRLCSDRMWRWRRSRYARQIHFEIYSNLPKSTSS